MTIKETHIALTSRGKPVTDPFYSFAFDDKWGDKGGAWGLAYAERMTHMCYGIDYAKPADALERSGELWYFDVGRELCCTRDELRAAFERLGMLGEVVRDAGAGDDAALPRP